MGRVWCIHVNVGSQNLMLSADGNDGMRTGVLQSSNLSLPNDSIPVRSLLDKWICKVYLGKVLGVFSY